MVLVVVAAAGCASRPPPPSGPPPEYERPIVRPWGSGPSAPEAPGQGADLGSSVDAGDGGTSPAPVAPGED